MRLMRVRVLGGLWRLNNENGNHPIDAKSVEVAAEQPAEHGTIMRDE